MIRRAIIRFVPVGVACTWMEVDKGFIKYSTFCSDDEDSEHEFYTRQKLVESMCREGKSNLIPESIFQKTSTGKFHPIPTSLASKYLSLTSAPPGISDADNDPRSKTVIRSKTDKSKPKASLISRVEKVAALYKSALNTKAHQELTMILNDENIKVVQDLPADAVDILPRPLMAARVDYEEATNAVRIDSKRLASLRSAIAVFPEMSVHSSSLSSPATKKSRFNGNSPGKEMELQPSDDSEFERDKLDISETMSSITRSSRVPKSQASVASRSRLHKKCDDERCKCMKRVARIGCCDVCRIHFLCECGDCMFAGGKESSDPNIQTITNEKRSKLDAEAKHYADISVKGEEKRLGYIFDRLKETIYSESASGRQIHDWRVGRRSSVTESCDKGFIRFYRTSSKTLYNMRNKSTVITKGKILVEQDPTSSKTHVGEFTEDVPKHASKQQFKQFSKRASLIHSVILDDDEKASIRWAPGKGSSAIEEAYGWMYQHFDLVAEDMPNRYNNIAVVYVSVAVFSKFTFILINNYLGVGKNILLSLASSKTTTTHSTRRKWKGDLAQRNLSKGTVSISYGKLGFQISNFHNLLPYKANV